MSPAFDFSSQPQSPKSQQQLKEQAVDVQVTKENLKQYTQSDPSRPAFVKQYSQAPPISSFVTGIPGRNHFPIGYVDYDFQKPRPSQNSPNPMTYEVSLDFYLTQKNYQIFPKRSPKVNGSTLHHNATSSDLRRVTSNSKASDSLQSTRDPDSSSNPTFQLKDQTCSKLP